MDQALFDHLLDDAAKVAVADPKTQGQLIHLGLEGPIFIAMLQKMRSEAFLDRIMKVGRSQIVDLVQFLSQGLGRRAQKGWIKQEALLKVLGWELDD